MCAEAHQRLMSETIIVVDLFNRAFVFEHVGKLTELVSLLKPPCAKDLEKKTVRRRERERERGKGEKNPRNVDLRVCCPVAHSHTKKSFLKP